MRQDRFDIHQHVTDQIIAMLEKGAGEFQLPWHRPGSSATRPVNAATKAPYRGVNILALWAAAEEHGYGSGLWGTYRQWAALGARSAKAKRRPMSSSTGTVAPAEVWSYPMGTTTDQRVDSSPALRRSSPPSR